MSYDFGVLGQKPYDTNPPVNPNGTYPVLHKKGIAGSILKVLVGYDENPEWLRIIVYLSYWAVIWTYVFRTYRKPKNI